MMAQGVYRIPKISYECAVALTNTTPMGAFRGAGRPEAAAMLERILDMAADELGIDPGRDAAPQLPPARRVPVHDRRCGTEYDSGDYDAALTEALRVAGYDELRAEQAERRARGDRVAARHRRERVRRDHRGRRRRASSGRSRSTTTAPRPSGSAPRRTARVTPRRSR